MNKKFINVTINLFKASLLVVFGLIALQGCQKDEDSLPLPTPVSVDSVYAINTSQSKGSLFKVEAIYNKLSQKDVIWAKFEYSSTPDFKNAEIVNFTKDYYTPDISTIGFERDLVYFNQTRYWHLIICYRTDQGPIQSTSQTKILKTAPFPSIHGPKFVIGYNDSLFTIDREGGDLKFLSRGRNISSNGKIIQVVDSGLQNIETSKIMTIKTKYYATGNNGDKYFTTNGGICDFSNDGSLVLCHYGQIYKNGVLIKSLGDVNRYYNIVWPGSLSFDGTKIVYTLPLGNGSYTITKIYDIKNYSDITVKEIDINGGANIGALNRSNSKMVILSNYGLSSIPNIADGMLNICEPTTNGADNLVPLYPNNDPNFATLFPNSDSKYFWARLPISSENDSVIYFIVQDGVKGATHIYGISATGGTPTKLSNSNINGKCNLFKLVNFE